MIKSDSFNEIYSQMGNGNIIRSVIDNSILANYAIAKINQSRTMQELDGRLIPTPSNCTAYLFDSLKHPDESKTLRETYGASYYQISVFSSEKQRASYLLKKKNIKKSEAYILMEKDISEKKVYSCRNVGNFKLLTKWSKS